MVLFSKRFDEFYLLDGRLKNIYFSAVKDYLEQKQKHNNRYKSYRLFPNLIKRFGTLFRFFNVLQL